MKRYNIPIENGKRDIEEMIWKFPFYDNLSGIKKQYTNGERIIEIGLCPEAIQSLYNTPHMIVVTKKEGRKNLLSLEKIFPDYKTARKEYNKKGLSIGFADLLTVFSVHEIKNSSRQKLYEAGLCKCLC